MLYKSFRYIPQTPLLGVFLQLRFYPSLECECYKARDLLILDKIKAKAFSKIKVGISQIVVLPSLLVVA